MRSVRIIQATRFRALVLCCSRTLDLIAILHISLLFPQVCSVSSLRASVPRLAKTLRVLDFTKEKENKRYCHIFGARVVYVC